jgi:CBS-domain-containing membrane protein
VHTKDIMSSPVHLVWQNASVESAAELMTAKSVTALPVVDANGGLVGMVSEGDCYGTGCPRAVPGISAVTVRAVTAS